MSMGRRLICYPGLGFRVVHQDHLRAFPGGRDFEHRLEWRLGLVNTMRRLFGASTGSEGPPLEPRPSCDSSCRGVSQAWARRTQTTTRLPYRSAQSVAIPPRTCLGRHEVSSSGLLASSAEVSDWLPLDALQALATQMGTAGHDQPRESVSTTLRASRSRDAKRPNRHRSPQRSSRPP